MDSQNKFYTDNTLIIKSFSGDEETYKDEETGEDIIFVTNARGDIIPYKATAENYLKFEQQALGEDPDSTISQDELRRAQLKVEVIKKYKQEAMKREKNPEKLAEMQADFAKELVEREKSIKGGFKPERNAAIIKKRAQERGMAEPEYKESLKARYQQAKRDGSLERNKDTNIKDLHAQRMAAKIGKELGVAGVPQHRLEEYVNGMAVVGAILNAAGKGGKENPTNFDPKSLNSIAQEVDFLGIVDSLAKQMSGGDARLEKSLTYDLAYAFSFVASQISGGGKVGDYLAAHAGNYFESSYEEKQEEYDENDLDIPEVASETPKELPAAFSRAEGGRLQALYAGGDSGGTVKKAHQVALHSMARIIESMGPEDRKKALKKIEENFDIAHKEGFLGSLNSGVSPRDKGKLVSAILREAEEAATGSLNDKVNSVIHMAGLLGQIDGAAARTKRTSLTRQVGTAKAEELWNETPLLAGRAKGTGPNVVFDLMDDEDRKKLLISNSVLKLRGGGKAAVVAPEASSAEAPRPSPLFSDEEIKQTGKGKFSLEGFDFELVRTESGEVQIKSEKNGTPAYSEPFKLPNENSQKMGAIKEKAREFRSEIDPATLEQEVKQAEVIQTPQELNSPVLVEPGKDKDVAVLDWLKGSGFNPKEKAMPGGDFGATFLGPDDSEYLVLRTSDGNYAARNKKTKESKTFSEITDLQKWVSSHSNEPKAAPAPKPEEPAQPIPSPQKEMIAAQAKQRESRQKAFSFGKDPEAPSEEVRAGVEAKLDSIAKEYGFIANGNELIKDKEVIRIVSTGGGSLAAHVTLPDGSHVQIRQKTDLGEKPEAFFDRIFQGKKKAPAAVATPAATPAAPAPVPEPKPEPTPVPTPATPAASTGQKRKVQVASPSKDSEDMWDPLTEAQLKERETDQSAFMSRYVAYHKPTSPEHAGSFYGIHPDSEPTGREPPHGFYEVEMDEDEIEKYSFTTEGGTKKLRVPAKILKERGKKQVKPEANPGEEKKEEVATPNPQVPTPAPQAAKAPASKPKPKHFLGDESHPIVKHIESSIAEINKRLNLPKKEQLKIDFSKEEPSIKFRGQTMHGHNIRGLLEGEVNVVNFNNQINYQPDGSSEEFKGRIRSDSTPEEITKFLNDFITAVKPKVLPEE